MKISFIDSDIDYQRRNKLTKLSNKIQFAYKNKDSKEDATIQFLSKECDIEAIYNTLMEYLELENHSNMNIGNLDLSKLLNKE